MEEVSNILDDWSIGRNERGRQRRPLVTQNARPYLVVVFVDDETVAPGLLASVVEVEVEVETVAPGLLASVAEVETVVLVLAVSLTVLCTCV